MKYDEIIPKKNIPIGNLVDEMGLYTTIKFLGGFRTFLDKYGNNLLTRKDTIKCIKDGSNFICKSGETDRVILCDYDEPSVILSETKRTTKLIEGFDNEGVFVDVYTGGIWGKCIKMSFKDVHDEALGDILLFLIELLDSYY